MIQCKFDENLSNQQSATRTKNHIQTVETLKVLSKDRIQIG